MEDNADAIVLPSASRYRKISWPLTASQRLSNWLKYCTDLDGYELMSLLSTETWAATKKALSLCGGATSSGPGS